MQYSKRMMIKSLSDSKHLNSLVNIAGWVKRVRKLGNLIFITVADKTGVIQVIDSVDSESFSKTQNLSRESVISVEGILQKRSNPNHEIVLGDLEIKLSNINIISVSKTPPLIIEDITDALEDVRLKYRYLDLRRPIMQQRLEIRFKFLLAIRNYLAKMDFTEVETPTLTKPTPEGARDYVVPTRLGSNRFYALPQSPQIYKQLLMIAGLEKYFQIAKCYRDEDGRKDRQPEHTQIDIEMSFCNEQIIQDTIEKMFINVFKEVLQVDLKFPFIRMTYAEALKKYGTDKPDIRFGVLLEDANSLFLNSSFKIFKDLLADNGYINLIHLDNFLVNAKLVKELEKLAKDNGANGLAWITYDNQKIIDGSLQKFITFNDLEKFKKLASKGSLFFVGNKNLEVVQKSLGAVRNHLNEIYHLANDNEYAFLWITDWPLYEWNDKTKQWDSAHNLFTSPKLENIKNFATDKANALAASYDLVLNGYELGSGAIRIHDPKIQKQVMLSLGLSESEANEKFGFLLEAYEYGAPVHGGIGLGLDRILMLICKASNIREVIAFPKNVQGYDLMMQTPSAVVDNDFLKEIYISIIKNKDEKSK